MYEPLDVSILIMKKRQENEGLSERKTIKVTILKTIPKVIP